MSVKGLSIHFILQPLPLITGVNRTHYQHILTQISQLVDQGVIKPLIDSQQFAMPDIASAHQYFEDNKATGKVVIRGFAVS